MPFNPKTINTNSIQLFPSKIKLKKLSPTPLSASLLFFHFLGFPSLKKKIPFSQETNREQKDKAKQKNRYNHHYATALAPPGPPHHRHRGKSGRAVKPQPDPLLTVMTSFQILCHDMKAGGVIGKSRSIIKSIRQHIGTWINMH